MLQERSKCQGRKLQSENFEFSRHSFELGYANLCPGIDPLINCTIILCSVAPRLQV